MFYEVLLCHSPDTAVVGGVGDVSIREKNDALSGFMIYSTADKIIQNI